jgi:uncharacterized protein YxeA
MKKIITLSIVFLSLVAFNVEAKTKTRRYDRQIYLVKAMNEATKYHNEKNSNDKMPYSVIVANKKGKTKIKADYIRKDGTSSLSNYSKVYKF